jgi:hypothetical protein
LLDEPLSRLGFREHRDLRDGYHSLELLREPEGALQRRQLAVDGAVGGFLRLALGDVAIDPLFVDLDGQHSLEGAREVDDGPAEPTQRPFLVGRVTYSRWKRPYRASLGATG